MGDRTMGKRQLGIGAIGAPVTAGGSEPSAAVFYSNTHDSRVKLVVGRVPGVALAMRKKPAAKAIAAALVRGVETGQCRGAAGNWAARAPSSELSAQTADLPDRLRRPPRR
jgi:hypothetical protein